MGINKPRNHIRTRKIGDRHALGQLSRRRADFCNAVSLEDDLPVLYPVSKAVENRHAGKDACTNTKLPGTFFLGSLRRLQPYTVDIRYSVNHYKTPDNQPQISDVHGL